MNALVKPMQIASVSASINLTALRLDVWRAVAVAEICGFENQADRARYTSSPRGLAGAERPAADLLVDVAVSNGLVGEHVPTELIESIIRTAWSAMTVPAWATGEPVSFGVEGCALRHLTENIVLDIKIDAERPGSNHARLSAGHVR